MSDSRSSLAYWRELATTRADLIRSIQSALGTTECGTALVEVARRAHQARGDLLAMRQSAADLMRQLQERGEA